MKNYYHFFKFFKMNPHWRFFFLGTSILIYIIKYEKCEPIQNIVNRFSSNFLLPQILLPTKISTASTLIDNTVCNLFFFCKYHIRQCDIYIFWPSSSVSFLYLTFLLIQLHQNPIFLCITWKSSKKISVHLILINKNGKTFWNW